MSFAVVSQPLNCSPNILNLGNWCNLNKFNRISLATVNLRCWRPPGLITLVFFALCMLVFEPTNPHLEQLNSSVVRSSYLASFEFQREAYQDIPKADSYVF